VIGQPQEAVVAESDQRYTRSLIGVILLGLIALGATWILADRLVMRPVQALVAATRQLAAGNLQARSQGINHAGELGQLAQAFDEMAAQLEAKTTAMAHEITERTRAEEQVRLLNTTLEQRVQDRTIQLEAVNKELEAFSYSVSHDLRAPLRGIDGFSKILLEHYTPVLDAQGQLYLQRVRAATQRMAQLIDDLLNLSRITRSQMRIEAVDLSALACTLAAEFQQAEPERAVTFVIADNVWGQGDRQLLRIVLENLLGNAWKFTSKQPAATIEFGRLVRADLPIYYVRDTGAGFDMQYAGKLFGAFQRLHGMTEFPGTGIGLATVQRILHRHGGTIWAEGAVDQGATFYFTLAATADGRNHEAPEHEHETEVFGGVQTDSAGRR
jgi:light-regulated signal transduction histidine kinase (bacteriophytochrome)